MTRILAIDPGSQFVGLHDGNNRGSLDLTKGRKKVPERPERLGYLAETLADWIAMFGPYDFVAYEEQFVRGGAATKALFGAVGVIEAVAWSAGCGVLSVPQSSVRKWVRGFTPSLKDPKKMYACAAAHLGAETEGWTEHEIDAFVILTYVKEHSHV